jgi:acyl-CoA-binding protein
MSTLRALQWIWRHRFEWWAELKAASSAEDARRRVLALIDRHPL